MLLCPNDQAISPVSTCRSFDFTIAFESYILSCVPSALLLVLGALQIWSLRRASPKLHSFAKSSPRARALFVLKAVTALAVVSTNLATLVTWNDDSDTYSDPSLTAASVLAFVASIVGAVLAYREHFVTTHSSLFLPFYLLSTILCDIVRIRTFALTGFTHLIRDGRFFAAFCASFGARCLWFVTENIDKRQVILEQMNSDVPLPLESTATFVSRMFFGWATPLLIRGARSQLTLDNLDPISEDFDSMQLWAHGKTQWEKEVAGGGNHPLLWTLVKAFPSAVFAPILPCIVYSLAMIARPVAIHDAITFIDSYTTNGGVRQPVENGYGLAVGFFLIYAVYGVCVSWWMWQVNRGATMLRGFLLQAIYRKALRLHVEKAKETGSAKTGSMVSVETEKILMRFQSFYEPISALVIVIIGLILLYKQVGASFVAAILGVLAIMVGTPTLSKGVGPAQRSWQNVTDQRTKLVSSILRNIMPVKLSAYTAPLAEKVTKLREEEILGCRKWWIQVLKVSILTNTASGLINLLTLGTYAVVTILNPSAPPLTTARMFTVIAILSTIVQPFFTLGQGWASLVSAWTAVKRIEGFLLEEERIPQTSGVVEQTAELSASEDIVFRDASFGRGSDTFLYNLDAVVPHGKLTFVIGRVGSGKSTFLHACLGEVDIQGGSFSSPDIATAYCSQDAFLRGESIRDAIVFASEYDERWYRQVIRAVALDRDFEIFPDGDKTQATRTSGGQRQRISLARAVYAKAPRLVLDDVFSALDANTEETVFTALFDIDIGLLRGRTVILATNGIHRLEQADRIVALVDGRIREQGTFVELMAVQGVTCDLIRDFAVEPRRVAAALEQKEEDEEKDLRNAPTLVAGQDDEGRRGGTPWAVYRFYFSSMGMSRVAIAALLALGASAIPAAINIYQQYWSTSIALNARAGLKRYFGGYVALELFYFLEFALAVYYVFCTVSPIAGASMHRTLLNGVLGASVTTLEKGGGVGKLLNRFSSDIFEIDRGLPNEVLNVTFLALQILASLVLIIVSAPWVGLVIIGVLGIFIVIQRFYTRTSQQLRRLDLGSKTPLYSLLTDVVNADGIRTVRAFHAEEHFKTLNTATVAKSQRPYYLMNISRRWVTAYINWAVAIVNFSLVIIAVLLRNSTSAGIFAVGLIQATQMTNSLNYLMLSLVELEIGIVAIERVKEMGDLEPEEAAQDGGSKDAALLELKGLKEVWPRQGGIIFNNVVARYGKELEPVLKSVSFKIRAGDRVGIVGRTGSGKSTTLAVLFRMLEIDEGGSISIDGLDTRHLSLETLRQGMTLIAQEPLLLEMSIRDNLDLEGQASDAEIWDALEKCSIKHIVEALPAKLDETVSGSGRFSRGQKQLLALARALLRNRAIVCLDEATSSLDVETDQAIQRTLRSSFGHATIVTIAHRIATIIDYDQVLVLDHGVLAESGSPAELLRIEGGVFRSLVKGHEPAVEAEILAIEDRL